MSTTNFNLSNEISVTELEYTGESLPMRAKRANEARTQHYRDTSCQLNLIGLDEVAFFVTVEEGK